MVIQCSSCSTKYRLQLERVPDRRTFVKCRKCGEPIYIDPPEQVPVPTPGNTAVPPPKPVAAPPASDVIAPAPGADHESVGDTRSQSPVASSTALPKSEPPAASAHEVSVAAVGAPPQQAESSIQATAQGVTCPACDTRFRLPASALGRENLRLKCSRCGHVFGMGDNLAAEAVGRAAGHRPDFYPKIESRPDPVDRPMPVPDESKLDGMFDDFRDQSSPFEGRETPTRSTGGASTHADRPPAADLQASKPEATRNQPAPASGEAIFSANLERIGEETPAHSDPDVELDPEQAYLAAVSYDDGPPAPQGSRGTIPGEQKYRLFLSPQEDVESRTVRPDAARTATGARDSGEDVPGAGQTGEAGWNGGSDQPTPSPGEYNHQVDEAADDAELLLRQFGVKPREDAAAEEMEPPTLEGDGDQEVAAETLPPIPTAPRARLKAPIWNRITVPQWWIKVVAMAVTLAVLFAVGYWAGGFTL